MARSGSKQGKQHSAEAGRLFALEVALTSGPMTSEFLHDNPEVSRTIQIRGDQTLEQLHEAIFEAFDREEEHLYEFRLGKNPRSPSSASYVLEESQEEFGSSTPPAGFVADTAVGSLNLQEGDVFAYWFDFGDDWWHEITVASIGKPDSGGYPRMTESVGMSPPQYADEDEDGDWDDDDDDDEYEDDEYDDDYEDDEDDDEYEDDEDDDDEEDDEDFDDEEEEEEDLEEERY